MIYTNFTHCLQNCVKCDVTTTVEGV